MSVADGELRFIAHVREKDAQLQMVEEHLSGVARLARKNAEKLGLEDAGELIGLLHDIGKYGEFFQKYIGSAEGLIDQDSDDYVDAGQNKGRIDHSTAGAQFIWRKLDHPADAGRHTLAQILALSLASHHSGLIDCLTPNGTDAFTARMNKADAETHISEVLAKIHPHILKRIHELLLSPTLLSSFCSLLTASVKKERERILPGMDPRKALPRIHFSTGLLVRMLFSCLIDADRTDTIDFEKEGAGSLRQYGKYTEWNVLAQRLEKHLTSFSGEGSINQGRKTISNDCKTAAEREKGLFTLTVPTGGGKTLASLRFALHHALRHKDIDHIFYIIPYTTIIDQNAQVAREILEPPEERGKIVLECHSNLTEERETWRNKLLSENWDAPIVFITNVQFLETLFSGGTRSVRRMHQLARSILIFDEIQTLPVRTVHIFCNALNFLLDNGGVSAILCTATQPLLNGVNKELGALWYTQKNEILSDVPAVFNRFKRVEVVDKIRTEGYTDEEISAMALKDREEFGTCLVVANTTKTARNVYRNAKDGFENTVHLSANMCPAHRGEVLGRIRNSLKSEPQDPLICVATQVIEAGVDVDFGCGIRCMAGLDSIAQAAGRCNRHGVRTTGRLSIINPKVENIDKLVDIKTGRAATQRILHEIRTEANMLKLDPLSPPAIKRYFQYYFYERAQDMSYSVATPRDDTLLNMLSGNEHANAAYLKKNIPSSISLTQSFSSAAELFKAIEAPTRGIVVPYGQGENIITALCGKYDLSEYIILLHRAQQFSVNIYPNVFQTLCNQGALHEITARNEPVGLGIWALRPEYYSPEFGVSQEPVFKSRTEVY